MKKIILMLVGLLAPAQAFAARAIMEQTCASGNVIMISTASLAVGINTCSPAYPLDLNGSFRLGVAASSGIINANALTVNANGTGVFVSSFNVAGQYGAFAILQNSHMLWQGNAANGGASTNNFDIDIFYGNEGRLTQQCRGANQICAYDLYPTLANTFNNAEGIVEYTIHGFPSNIGNGTSYEQLSFGKLPAAIGGFYYFSMESGSTSTGTLRDLQFRHETGTGETWNGVNGPIPGQEIYMIFAATRTFNSVPIDFLYSHALFGRDNQVDITNSYFIGRQGGDFIFNTAASSNLDVLVNGSTITWVNATGLGIGKVPVTTLDVAGNAQFGSGVSKSTFSANGALTIASGQNLILQGTGGGINVGNNSASVSGSIILDDNTNTNKICGGVAAVGCLTFRDSATGYTIINNAGGFGTDIQISGSSKFRVTTAGGTQIGGSVANSVAFSSAPVYAVNGFNAVTALASGTTIQSFIPDSAITLTRLCMTILTASAGGSGDTMKCNNAAGTGVSVTSSNAAAAGTTTCATTGAPANIAYQGQVFCHLDTGAATKPEFNMSLNYVLQ